MEMPTAADSKRNTYRVAMNRAAVLSGKYLDCEFVEFGLRRKVRKLSAVEISAFTRAIELRIERKERAFAEHAAGVRSPQVDLAHPHDRASAVSRRSVV